MSEIRTRSDYDGSVGPGEEKRSVTSEQYSGRRHGIHDRQCIKGVFQAGKWMANEMYLTV